VVILGIADGPDSGAALVVDDRVVGIEEQERHDQVPRSRAFPDAAVDAVLRQAGLRPRDVNLIGVAGRFSPPLIVRRNRRLSGLTASSPFSAAADLAVLWSGAMRQTGFGALEAERAAEWLEAQFRARGFAPQRLIAMDLHKALAEAVYRCQPEDDVLVLTLHPQGDGAAFAVHRGRAGQLDRVFEQRGFGALHLHLGRAFAALGLEPLVDDDRLFGLAGRGTARPELLELLRSRIGVHQGALVQGEPFVGRRRSRAVYGALGEASPSDAAASLLAHLSEVVRELVRFHARAQRCRVIGLGGILVENPRIIAAVAEIDEVDRVCCHPTPGYASLPTGAAVGLAGTRPQLLPLPGLGGDVDPAACRGALAAAGLAAAPVADPVVALADALATGPVGRFAGRAGFGRAGLGNRAVLVRADRPDDVAAARRRLGRAGEEEPSVIALPTAAAPDAAVRLAACLPTAVAAPRVDTTFAKDYPAVVAPDGRAVWQTVSASGDPVLHGALVRLAERTGCTALAAWPLSGGREPVVSRPADALRGWRGPLLLGDLWVEARG
jgi:carbamoyltransferase